MKGRGRHLRAITVAVLVVVFTSFGWRCSPGIEGRGDPVSAQNLKAHVKFLSDAVGNRDAFAAYGALIRSRDYISESLKRNGYGVEFQEYEVGGRKVCNIIAAKSGTDQTKAPIVVGAHYDSCGNPGADDNASGVAVLLEIARSVATSPCQRTARFVFFVNEEPPFFKTDAMGSRVYARRLKEHKENIYGAVVLEAVGYYTDRPFSQKYPPLIGLFYPHKGNFLAVVGNIRSHRLAAETARALRGGIATRSLVIEGVPVASFSDHGSFWQEGFRGVMVTDTAFLRNRDYHTPADTYEKLDYNAMARIVNALAVWLEGL